MRVFSLYAPVSLIILKCLKLFESTFLCTLIIFIMNSEHLLHFHKAAQKKYFCSNPEIELSHCSIITLHSSLYNFYPTFLTLLCYSWHRKSLLATMVFPITSLENYLSSCRVMFWVIAEFLIERWKCVGSNYFVTRTIHKVAQ